MKFNEMCLIITQFPQALIHSDTEVYYVATEITGSSVVGPTLL